MVGAMMHMGARGSGEVEHDGKGGAVGLSVRQGRAFYFAIVA
jgi:hypothetical protein